VSETLHVVRVTVGGEEVSIRTELPPEHAIAVGEHVEATLRRIREAAPTFEAGKVALLAALQIADELLRARGDAEAADATLREAQAELNRMLPPGRRVG
jgi:cell division protein ZapA (FtsZ GTPase activity inhibitor)